MVHLVGHLTLHGMATAINVSHRIVDQNLFKRCFWCQLLEGKPSNDRYLAQVPSGRAHGLDETQ